MDRRQTDKKQTEEQHEKLEQYRQPAKYVCNLSLWTKWNTTLKCNLQWL